MPWRDRCTGFSGSVSCHGTERRRFDRRSSTFDRRSRRHFLDRRPSAYSHPRCRRHSRAYLEIRPRERNGRHHNRAPSRTVGPALSAAKACGKQRAAAAIPCYVDDDASLERVIRETLASHDVSISAEASGWLVGRLGSDRAVSRGRLRN